MKICDDKEGTWDSRIVNASFRRCRAISIYDLVINMKRAVYRHREELSESPIQKGPAVFHGFGSNYNLNVQALKNCEEIEFFKVLTYFVSVLKKLS